MVKDKKKIRLPRFIGHSLLKSISFRAAVYELNEEQFVVLGNGPLSANCNMT